MKAFLLSSIALLLTHAAFAASTPDDFQGTYALECIPPTLTITLAGSVWVGSAAVGFGERRPTWTCRPRACCRSPCPLGRDAGARKKPAVANPDSMTSGLTWPSGRRNPRSVTDRDRNLTCSARDLLGRSLHYEPSVRFVGDWANLGQSFSEVPGHPPGRMEFHILEVAL